MRFCNYCGETLWPNPPEDMVSHGTDPYCNENCKQRERYENRRGDYDWHWSHDCSECNRPMFVPPGKDGFWCPECNRTEEIDKSGIDYIKDEYYGVNQLEHSCPECHSTLWTFDGAMQCHNDDCDVWISVYSGEWWALIEQEYPPRFVSVNQAANTVKTTQEKLTNDREN